MTTSKGSRQPFSPKPHPRSDSLTAKGRPPAGRCQDGVAMRIFPRFLALLLARLLGWIVAVARHPLTLNLLVIAAIITGLHLLDVWATRSWPSGDSWLATELRSKRPVLGKDEAFLTSEHVLALYALVLISWWITRERRRLLIARFDDVSSDKDKEKAGAAQAIAPLLANELAQIKELFEEFEEGRVIPSSTSDKGAARTGSRLFDATAQMDAPSGFLEGSVSAEAPLALGPLRIPIGVLTGLINRLVRGPRLSGQVQIEAERRFVTVSLDAGRLHQQWRIEDVA